MARMNMDELQKNIADEITTVMNKYQEGLRYVCLICEDPHLVFRDQRRGDAILVTNLPQTHAYEVLHQIADTLKAEAGSH